MHSPVTLRSHRVTVARPAGPTTGVSTRQSSASQKAGRDRPPLPQHCTAPVSSAVIHMPRLFRDLYPQAIPDMTGAMPTTDAHMSSPAVPAELLLAAVTGSVVTL